MIAAAAACLCATSIAAAKSIKDCEQIQEADAYNRCLAQFGPVAHEHRLAPVPSGANRGHGRRHWHHYGRRKRAVLD